MAVAGRFARGLLYSKVLFGTTKAGCYTWFRGDRLKETVSVQTASQDQSHMAVVLR